MADRPILFSAPMVRALIEGRKTQTRRVHFTQDPEFNPTCDDRCEPRLTRMCIRSDCNRRTVTKTKIHCGDRLWVREAWRTVPEYDGVPPRDVPAGSSRTTMADTGLTFPNQFWGKLRPSMFMPKWASRLTLFVEGVKVERLNAISREDAIAEGIDRVENNYGNGPAYCDYLEADPSDSAEWYSSPINSYQSLWDYINGPDAWSANPWVVAYTFRVVKGNIDQIGGAA